MASKLFDFVIVGAGPSGIFASLEILKKNPRTKIALLDMGKRIEKRKKSEVMCGFGGAGTYSDGKLHFTPKLSHERVFHLINEQKYQKILDVIEKTFGEFGVDAPFYPRNGSEVERFISESQRADIELIVRRAQHVGSDNLKEVVVKMQEHLLEGGVEIFDEVEVEDLIVERKACKGVVSKKGKRVLGRRTLFATGRVGAKKLQDLCGKYGISYQYGMVEVGVRVEFPEAIMKRHADALYEIVFKIRTKTFDDIIRTFCSCPNGFVAKETYRGYVCVNGYSNSDHKSKNSNFAFLCEVNMTEPVENSIAYAKSIAELASTIGGGKPILQRVADLRKGRRSTWRRLEKSITKPSLSCVTPGDISMALPHRVVVNILEGLEKLDRVMPGINSGSTLLYAPEVKFRSSQIVTNKKMETNLKNFFVAGDASGMSGSITGAAATGIMAARGMMRRR
jgi:hypothetical protein